jgi:colicin import membrane protein
MPSTADRIDLGPPRDKGAISSFGLALLVHAALIAALTWGVNWKRSDRSVAFEAELWSNTPQEAAPKLVEAPPPPPPSQPTEPAPKVQEVKPSDPNVDMALEQEKKRKLQAQKAQQARAEKELKLKQEQAKLKAAEEAKRLEAKKQLQQNQANAAALEAQRKQNIARALGLADASGGETAKGTAQKSAGPSASYGGMVRARVKPNIVFTEDIAGNPSAEVEVRTALDGTIMSQRLVKTSGNKAWDDAVVKAIIRTEKMPRDTDGRVPTPMILEFRPKD